MRPRHKAAENRSLAELRQQFETASMRPRHKAAENDGLTDDEGGHLDLLQ